MNNAERLYAKEQMALKHVPKHFAVECRVDPQIAELLEAKP